MSENQQVGGVPGVDHLTQEETVVFIHVTGEPSEEEDMDVPGLYRVILDQGVPTAYLGNAALDVFHEEIPIDCLDDFTITPYVAGGHVLENNNEIDSYVFRGRGHVDGMVDPDAVGIELDVSSSSPKI